MVAAEIELPVITADNVDEEWDAAEEAVRDAEYEFRQSGQETGLPARSHSRHYECDEVAAQILSRTYNTKIQ